MKSVTPLLFLLFPLLLSAQMDSLIVRPNGTNGKDAIVWSINPNTNYGSTQEGTLTAWTYQGTFSVKRFYIEFDLSSIPSGAQVDSAFLYYYNNPSAPSHSGQHFGTNDFIIRRVTSTWTENTITYNNQPSHTTTNEVTMPQTLSNTQNFKIPVDSLVQKQLDSANFGFFLRIKTESTYRAIVCASSDHVNAAYRPMLKVYYSSCSEPQADFAYTQQQNTVSFHDSSTTSGLGTTYHWDFGDGTFSTLQHPVKTYNQPGPFNACLTITDSCGSDTLCTLISLCEPKTVSYQYLALGYNVQFTAFPANAQSYLWDFGDGNMSTLQNPYYTYSANGIYGVCLTVNDTCTTDTFCHNVMINQVGLEEHKSGLHFIYPNPAGGRYIRVNELSAFEKIEILDISGHRILQWSGEEFDEKLPIDDLPPGTYLVSLLREGGERQTEILIRN